MKSTVSKKATIAKVLEALRDMAIAILAPQPVSVPVRIRTKSPTRR